ncbi:MAG: DUF2207 domain-containing protein [Armatimonadetes bacterium]|nr:DUF2207 domain-containing protein [Armatimonadota bacterium]NIM23482.1 DUF2207 domain-containing protein [Armatimonadota bacterium]NIM67348.1 DUF2207 domain-containing protein [Armatimonadota bacterium]NIM75849.1 DUF2207 domain-containing protein [Armatimonadota bacterium]NIN05534.1 DUF2207 domain-containing protein [Armatimonadota bacterium]
MMLRRLLPVLLIALLSATAVHARSLVIKSFHVDVVVLDNGTIDVTETIRPQFTGSWNGIYRTIPIHYRTSQGFNYKLFLDMQSITDGAGNPLKYKSRRQRHYQKFKIWVPGAVNATRTVVLHYRVPNALKYFGTYDELYWNVTGDEWEVPIQFASADFTFPKEVTGLRAVAFTGGYGSREKAAEVEIGDNDVYCETLRMLNFREGLTLAAAWDPGVVHRPDILTRAGYFLRANWIFIIPLIVFIIMFNLWRTRGRDPRLRPIAAQYEPPPDMTPAEVGTLADNSVNMRDIISTLVELAVQGYVTIESKPKEHWSGMEFLKKVEYTFHLRKEEEEWADLRPHQREMLSALFLSGYRKTVTLEELQNKFYKHIPTIRDCIYERLLKQHHYLQRPDKVKQGYLGGAVAVAVLVFIATGLGIQIGLAPVSFVVAGILSAGTVGVFGWFMPARTHRGTRALEHVLGLEEFLDKVESDRFERIVKTPEMFEKLLPYAMALGVESNWAKAFADICQEPPEWYHGGGFRTFHAGSFVSDLGQMSTHTTAAMASSPRSSGGSGFGGGGGFSGGGFGGGGGGGF